MCRFAPYGYIKDPESRKHWLLDEEAAENVRLIFDLYINGMGTKAIAQYLDNNGVLAPSEYMKSKGLPTSRASCIEKVKWTSSTVNLILSRQEYIGDVVNFKSTTKSYKNHKKVKIPVENRMVFKGVNEPVVSAEIWEKAQSILNKRKRVPRKKRTRYISIVSFLFGLLTKNVFKAKEIPE